MDRDLDSTSKVCLICQQNGLRPSFNDEESNNTGKFKVRLEIRTDPGSKHLFSYVGYGTSKKLAKKEASSAALRKQQISRASAGPHLAIENRRAKNRIREANRSTDATSDRMRTMCPATSIRLNRSQLLSEPQMNACNRTQMQPFRIDFKSDFKRFGRESLLQGEEAQPQTSDQVRLPTPE